MERPRAKTLRRERDSCEGTAQPKWCMKMGRMWWDMRGLVRMILLVVSFGSSFLASSVLLAGGEEEADDEMGTGPHHSKFRQDQAQKSK